MIDELLRETEGRMTKSLQVLENDLRTIRTGRASPALVERVVVDYYDTPTPLNQLAVISAPEPQLLTIRPYDPSSVDDIERAILKSDLGLTPSNDGKLIRLAIPRLSEERREELVKMVKHRLEEAKVSVRNCRRDAIDDLKELEDEKLVTEDDFYEGKDKIQELTNDFVSQIDDIGERKEQEIRQV